MWAKVESLVMQPEILAAEVERRRSSDPFAAELAAVENRLKHIAASRARLARAVAALENEDASVPLLAELKGLAEQAKVLESDRDRLSRAAAGWQTDRDLLEGLATRSTRVRENLPRLTYEERRN